MRQIAEGLQLLGKFPPYVNLYLMGEVLSTRGRGGTGRAYYDSCRGIASRPWRPGRMPTRTTKGLAARSARR